MNASTDSAMDKVMDSAIETTIDSAIDGAPIDRSARIAGDFAHWFARAGDPLDADETKRIHALIAPIAEGTAQIDALTGPALSRILVAEDHDSLWWDAEEGERERLWDVATDRTIESTLADRLAQIAQHRSTILRAVQRLHAIAVESTIAQSAFDAAMLALHQHTLADLAATPADHWFQIKFALFDLGRWPLGFRSGRFHVV